jgi:hypothetical protein
MTATDPRPEPASEPEPASAPAPPATPEVRPPRPARPEQAREDTDAAWGEYPDSGDERLYRDRPPHWADF